MENGIMLRDFRLVEYLKRKKRKKKNRSLFEIMDSMIQPSDLSSTRLFLKRTLLLFTLSFELQVILANITFVFQ